MLDPDFLEPERLRAFVAVAETGSFTRAAERLRLTQPAVSTQVRRLEEAIGRLLFERRSSSVHLTHDGEAMLAYARELLEVIARARRQFSRPRLEGKIRFGLVEDFNSTALPEILGRLRGEREHFELHTETELSVELRRRLSAGSLDLALTKRVVGRQHGELVGRQKLVWVGQPGVLGAGADPVPLVLYPNSSTSREIILRCLHTHGRSWNIRFESVGITGLRAAVLAGLGVTAFGIGMIPPDMVPLPAGLLPPLEDVEFVVEQHPQSNDPVVAAFATILRQLAPIIFDRLAGRTSRDAAGGRGLRPGHGGRFDGGGFGFSWLVAGRVGQSPPRARARSMAAA